MVEQAHWTVIQADGKDLPGGIAKVANDDRTIRGWVICCPYGCGECILFDETEDDFFTLSGECDLTFVNRRIVFHCCHKLVRLADGRFEEMGEA